MLLIRLFSLWGAHTAATVAAHLICADKNRNRLAFGGCLVLPIYNCQRMNIVDLFPIWVYICTIRHVQHAHPTGCCCTNNNCVYATGPFIVNTTLTLWYTTKANKISLYHTMHSLTQFTRMNVTHAHWTQFVLAIANNGGSGGGGSTWKIW